MRKNAWFGQVSVRARPVSELMSFCPSKEEIKVFRSLYGRPLTYDARYCTSCLLLSSLITVEDGCKLCLSSIFFGLWEGE
ncbi:uncharacterized protein [Macrobrachium rosenbergii]|uniref:uncharacterized protein isoform X4 n=1 Tax=Macrobrachium rosenbergii TaxID=79674 RepID=UPI0034D5DEC3